MESRWTGVALENRTAFSGFSKAAVLLRFDGVKVFAASAAVNPPIIRCDQLAHGLQSFHLTACFTSLRPDDSSAKWRNQPGVEERLNSFRQSYGQEVMTEQGSPGKLTNSQHHHASFEKSEAVEVLLLSTVAGGRGNVSHLWSRVSKPRRLVAVIGILLIAVVALSVCCAVLKGRKSPDHRDLTPVNYFEPPCAEHWIWYLGTCYFFSEDEGSWTFANKSCWEMNSSLALIDSAQSTLELVSYAHV
ncbi:hypothetical protein NDU88_000633 [Pleurodeles waltl]|uniref:Uncharacterized protein n=1 Tax=Pleurodeles waltl TaxID=8319 RepID=A0AAV7P319_PLEWA|nr:hypothetical protein NDU88_000633 [Pleurodeles waltl]